jgi:hypothetical protein
MRWFAVALVGAVAAGFVVRRWIRHSPGGTNFGTVSEQWVAQHHRADSP